MTNQAGTNMDITNNGATPIRVMVVDAEALRRRGIAAIIDAHPNLTQAGELTSQAEAAEYLRRCNGSTNCPDVLVLDLQLTGAMPIIEHVTGALPDCKIVVLTHPDQTYLIHAAMGAGVRGFLSKTSTADLEQQLVEAIRMAYAGHMYVAHSLTAVLQRPRGETSSPLTAREHEVLQLLAAGLTNDQIGQQLGISKNTVKTHTQRIYERLEVNGRAQATLVAQQLGLLRES